MNNLRHRASNIRLSNTFCPSVSGTYAPEERRRFSLDTRADVAESDLSHNTSAPRYLMVVKNLRFLYSHFWPLAEAVQRAGWEVWIAAAPDESPQRVLDAGMKYFELEEERGHWNPVAFIRSLSRTRYALCSINPRLAHFIYLKNVLTGSILARIGKTPAVLGAVTGLGTLFAQGRLIYRLARRGVLICLRWGFKHPNAVLALENVDDRNYFVSNHVIREERTVIIPGAGVEVNEIRPVSEPSGTPVILCAARMIRDKGILELVDAARLLRQRGFQFELQLAGGSDTGNPSAIAPEELARIEAEGTAKWLGHCSNVSSLLGSASIFCLPTYYREGLPRVLVEAGAAGLPIVTTDVPGCREVVIPGKNGLLVPPRNVSALADALQYLLENHEQRKEMRIASRLIFEEKFTSDAVRKAFNRCYEKLSVPLVLS
jgi:glycosyltransferase involved in cell wall biosynthesis